MIHILLDNATSHTQKNGEIIVLLEKDNKEIILEVKNTGEPIKKGEEKNIFERFYRGDEARNRDHNHYGLGLSIAKNIVINHKGEIVAFSKDGYTTFKVTWKSER